VLQYIVPMTTFRRYLVLQLLMLWQGGFLFYASFVVPVGTDLLGSSQQGTITVRVTDSLNFCGVAGLALFAWELIAQRDASRRRKLSRWCLWLIAAFSQVLLYVIHHRLEDMMDPTRMSVVKPENFYRVHGYYLWASSIQWAACLALLWVTLRTWRDSDWPNEPSGTPPQTVRRYSFFVVK
jgi:hypothetical protein